MKVRILRQVGDPRNGVILRAGAIVDLPKTWAERYVEQGSAELVKADPKPSEKGDGKKKQ